jgi:hypothetical protein
MLAYLGSDNADQARDYLAAELDDFFKRRNYIAHAFKLSSSSGPAQLNKDIQLFSIFGRALQRALDREFNPVPPLGRHTRRCAAEAGID